MTLGWRMGDSEREQVMIRLGELSTREIPDKAVQDEDRDK